MATTITFPQLVFLVAVHTLDDLVSSTEMLSIWFFFLTSTLFSSRRACWAVPSNLYVYVSFVVGFLSLSEWRSLWKSFTSSRCLRIIFTFNSSNETLLQASWNSKTTNQSGRKMGSNFDFLEKSQTRAILSGIVISCFLHFEELTFFYLAILFSESASHVINLLDDNSLGSGTLCHLERAYFQVVYL